MDDRFRIDELKIKGSLEILIDDNGSFDRKIVENTVLVNGKNAVVKSLGYDIGGSFQFYVDRMLFGDGGEESDVPKRVDPTNTALFGNIRANVSANASFSPDVLNQVVFTSVLSKSHAVGHRLNEAALQLANGNLFSMLTFSGIPKSDTMTLTFNWTLTVI